MLFPLERPQAQLGCKRHSCRHVAAPACRSLQEFTAAPGLVLLTAFLLHEGAAGAHCNSFYAPYFHVLPQKLSSLPVCWPDDHWLHSTIKGSHLERQVRAKRPGWKSPQYWACSTVPLTNRIKCWNPPPFQAQFGTRVCFVEELRWQAAADLGGAFEFARLAGVSFTFNK